MRSKRHFVFGLISGLALILFMGCATAHKRAEEFMEKGLFADAVRQYEQILKGDPTDQDAITGLRSARDKFIGRRLIDTRMARLAGNPEQSMDMLLEAVNKATDWQLPPSGAVAFTQEEEAGYAWQYTRQRVVQDLDANRPLRAEFFLRKYRPVFGGKLTSSFDSLRASVLSKGKASCGLLQKERKPGQHYFNRFLANYCRYWGETFAGDDAAQIPNLIVPYVKALATQGKPEGMPEDLVALLRESLTAAVTKTAWYDAGAKLTLEVSLKGRFSAVRTRDSVPLTHVYSVQEPYTEYVQVTKKRSVPYTEAGVTRYREEEYKATEPKTSYRDVKRQFNYFGWRHEQKVSLDMTAQGALSDRPVEVVLNEVLEENGTEHNERQPAIGLNPSHPKITAQPAWVKEQGAKLATAFEAKLVQLWKDLYCASDAKADSLSVTGDQVHLCLRQTMASYPQVSENWYQSHLGLGVSEAWSLIGRP